MQSTHCARRSTANSQRGRFQLCAKRGAWRTYLAVAVTLSLTSSGCLNSSYTVHKDALLQQAALPPESRGEVRATQRLGTDVDPVAASGPPVAVFIGPGGRLGRRPGPRIRNRRRGGGSGGSGGGDDDGKGAAIALVVTSVAVGLSLAATEGMRFEGDLLVSPDHPIHLRGPGGDAWVPLAELTPELAAWADDGVLLEYDGAVQRLRRAPLNRRGVVFAVDLGASAEHSFQSDVEPQFASRVSLGVFPVHQVGLLAGAGVGFGSQGAPEWRLFGELQVYPLQLGALEIGAYGQFGQLYGEADNGPLVDQSVDTLFGAGGLLLQFDLTTRLALTLRGGVMYASDPQESFRPEALIGLAVY